MELSPHPNRDQLFMTSLDMLVEPDSIVRVIDVFLDYAESCNLSFKQHHSNTGRPAFPNRVLIGIYIYGYLHRIRSSRQLEKASETDFSIIMLCYNLRRAISIIGPNALKQGLNSLVLPFFILTSSTKLLLPINFHQILQPPYSVSA